MRPAQEALLALSRPSQRRAQNLSSAMKADVASSAGLMTGNMVGDSALKHDGGLFTLPALVTRSDTHVEADTLVALQVKNFSSNLYFSKQFKN
jgi:hypothetical protein